MLKRLFRFLIFRLVRLFYSRIDVHGREHLSPGEPTIYVLNHPNGLLDPMLLMLALGQPVSFLAKSTFWGNPIGRSASEAFYALPIYRTRDKGKRGGPKDAREMAERNEATFARARRLLKDGRAMALFPEGTTHSEPELLPLRTGAARIALNAEAESDWTLKHHIVPVGLWYENKTRFRSSALVVIGESFTLTEYAEAFVANERPTVQAVTERIDEGLDEVVLQAENADLLTAIPVVAAWTASEEEAPDLARRHTWATTLMESYQKLHHTDPERLEQVAETARRYASLLQAVGIVNPWHLEDPTINRKHLAGRLGALLLTAVPALAGFLMSYGPYRLAGVVTAAAARGDHSVIGTYKLIIGSVFVLVGWILEAVVCGMVFGPAWGLALFVAAPLLGYTALRWGESSKALRVLVSYQWLRERRGGLVALLADRRQTLTHDVMEAVASVS